MPVKTTLKIYADMGMAKRRVRNMNQTGTWMLRGAGFFIAAYGAYAFVKRDIGTYMLMQSHFVLFDYEEPLIRFFAYNTPFL